MAEEKGAESGSVLVIGATGYIGGYIVRASVAAGFSTSALVRHSAVSDPRKLELIGALEAAGVRIIHGSLEDHESLVAALRRVDIVISAVGIPQVPDQLKLVEAMKEVGTVKRFIPSEFGQDVDKVVCLKPCQEALIEPKVRIRRAAEAAGIPYTYVVTNGFAKFFFSIQEHNGKLFPPTENVVIFGDGNVKASFVAEEDIGTCTIKAAKDPRTLNKTLFIRPPANALSQNETIAIVESKIGKSFQKKSVSEEELLKQIEETSGSFRAVILSLMHSSYIKGSAFSFQLGPNDVEAHELYPDIAYIDAHKYLSRFI